MSRGEQTGDTEGAGSAWGPLVQFFKLSQFLTVTIRSQFFPLKKCLKHLLNLWMDFIQTNVENKFTFGMKSIQYSSYSQLSVYLSVYPFCLSIHRPVHPAFYFLYPFFLSGSRGAGVYLQQSLSERWRTPWTVHQTDTHRDKQDTQSVSVWKTHLHATLKASPIHSTNVLKTQQLLQIANSVS